MSGFRLGEGGEWGERCALRVGQALRTHSDPVTSAAPQRPGTAAAAEADRQAGKAAKRPRNTQVRQQPEKCTMEISPRSGTVCVHETQETQGKGW